MIRVVVASLLLGSSEAMQMRFRWPSSWWPWRSTNDASTANDEALARQLQAEEIAAWAAGSQLRPAVAVTPVSDVFDAVEMRQHLTKEYPQASDDLIQIAVDGLSTFDELRKSRLRSAESQSFLLYKLKEFEKDGLLGPHYGAIPQVEAASMLDKLKADLDLSMLAEADRSSINASIQALKAVYASGEEWTDTRYDAQVKVEKVKNDFRQRLPQVELTSGRDNGLFGPHHGAIPQDEAASMLKKLEADLDLSMLAEADQSSIDASIQALKGLYDLGEEWTDTRYDVQVNVEQVKNDFMKRLQQVELTSGRDNICMVDTLYSFVTQEGCEKRQDRREHETAMYAIKKAVYTKSRQSPGWSTVRAGARRSASGMSSAGDTMVFKPKIVKLILKEIHDYLQRTNRTSQIEINLSGPIALHSLLAYTNAEGEQVQNGESIYFPQGVLDTFTDAPVQLQNGYLLNKKDHWSNLRPSKSTHPFYADPHMVRDLEAAVDKAMQVEVMEYVVDSLPSNVVNGRADALKTKLASNDALRGRFMTTYQSMATEPVWRYQEILNPFFGDLEVSASRRSEPELDTAVFDFFFQQFETTALGQQLKSVGALELFRQHYGSSQANIMAFATAWQKFELNDAGDLQAMVQTCLHAANSVVLIASAAAAMHAQSQVRMHEPHFGVSPTSTTGRPVSVV